MLAQERLHPGRGQRDHAVQLDLLIAVKKILLHIAQVQDHSVHIQVLFHHLILRKFSFEAMAYLGKAAADRAGRETEQLTDLAGIVARCIALPG